MWRDCRMAWIQLFVLADTKAIAVNRTTVVCLKVRFIHHTMRHLAALATIVVSLLLGTFASATTTGSSRTLAPVSFVRDKKKTANQQVGRTTSSVSSKQVERVGIQKNEDSCVASSSSSVTLPFSLATTLRGGGGIGVKNSDQVKTSVVYLLLGYGFLSELLLAFRPQQAASHFSQALDVTTTQMMRGLGYSHMSTTMTAALMMLASQNPMQAVAWGTLPRVLYVAYMLANPNPASELNAKDLIPPYAIVLTCCGLGLWKESWAK